MKKNYWFMMCLLFAGCGSSVHRFEVTGVDGEFCVPKTGYVSPDIWWIPEDAPGAPQGFSFGGCHQLKPDDRASCVLPAEFIGSSVESLQEKPGRLWSELKFSADYDMQVNQPGAEYRIDSATGMLILFNPNVWPEWSVWKRGMGHAVQESLAMRDDDELIATCSEIEKFPPGTDGLGNKNEYGCSRYVRGKRYALGYHFVSKKSVPTDAQMKALEAALFNQVDRWQCPK